MWNLTVKIVCVKDVYTIDGDLNFTKDKIYTAEYSGGYWFSRGEISGDMVAADLEQDVFLKHFQVLEEPKDKE